MPTLDKLKVLNLSFNQLMEIPDWIGMPSSLADLPLKGN
jgi:Leucine-rich repeat (LRR) protein